MQSVRRSSIRQAHTTKNRMEVLCPRVTQAAMIAAASSGPRTHWAPLLSCGEGLGVGGRELWLQTRPYSHRAKHLGRHDHLGLVPPLIQLEKRSGEFRREQKVLSRISGLSGRDHTLEAVVRKLGVNRQQSLARARRAWEYGRKVPEFLNPTKEHGFIQPQSGGKDAFDSEPACLS